MQGLTPAVFRFEVRYHVRRPSFWLIAALFFGFGLADMVSNGSRGNAFFYVNSPSQIFQTSVWYTIFSVLAAAAFVAETFVRDARIGMESLVLATPVRKRYYLGTRFAAAFAVTVAAFSCYLPGMLLGGLVPGLNPYAIGPLRPEAYAYSYLAVVLPNLFVVSVFAFAVAARTRSIVLTYAAAVVLVMLYLAAMLMIGLDDVDYDHFRWWAMLDPFGFFALGAQSTAWTVHQHNTLMPTLSGLFAQNRLFWLVLSGIVWVLSYRGFTMALPTPGRRGSRVRAIAEPEQRPAPVHSVSTTPAAASGALAGLAIAVRAARFELELILRSRAFLILTACGLLSLFFAAAGSKSFDFSDPSTDILVHSASLYFKYILFAIVVLYAAEVTWRDRDVGLQNVIDATPVPTGTMVASKLLALFGVVTLHLLLCMLVMVIYQTVKGYFAYDLRLSAQMLFLGLGPYFYFLAVLALFCQAVLRHRYAGMAAVVLISLLPIPFDALGWFHNLYRFGATNDIGYSPMNGYGHLFTGHLWFIAYWALFSTALALLTCIVWPRGSLSDWRGHWSRSWRQSSLRIRSGLTFAGVAFALVGTWIFYNTTVLNAYQPPGKEETSAQMERLFRRYEHLPMPVVIHTGLRIELHPEQRYFVAHGEYLLENRTGVPIREIHLSTFIHLRLAEVSYPGARLHEAHPEWGYYIYHLDEPLLPGARQTMHFVTRIEEPRGFLNQVDSDDVYMVYPNEVVGNGTNLYSPFILPFIGYTKMVEHKGQMILETIEAQIGRPALLAAIREFFDAHKARGAPYATVLDLRDAIVRRTPPQLRAQVGELFEAVVTYRVGIADATVAPAPGGGYRVRMVLETGKLYTERLGEQRSVPLDLPLSFVVKDEQGQVLRAGTIPASHLNRPVEVDVAGGRPHRVAVDPAYALPAAFVQNRERTLRPAAPDAVARSNAQQPGDSPGGESN